jgi:hypothetical protein
MLGCAMNRIRSNVALLALLMLLAAAGGCANPWKDSFEPNRDLGNARFGPTTLSSDDIREVEFERLQQYTAAERQRRIGSTTAPADLPADEKRAAKDRLLEALQLPWRGDEAEVIGSSQFVSAEPLKPRTDKRLLALAEKNGANTVVVSSAYLGREERTETIPITSHTRDIYVTHAYDRQGRRVPRVSTYDSSSTTWVPTQVIEDRYAYHAFFIRRRGSNR